jgi:hypothetical protein
MSLLQNDEVVSELFEKSSRKQKYSQLKCFEKVVNKNRNNEFSIHIFSDYSDSCDELREKWKDVNSDIAWFFQSEREIDIERMNIYIIYFVKDVVPVTFKSIVEHDKYSTRKMVVDNFTEYSKSNRIIEKINERLFDKINRDQSNEETSSLLETILTYDKVIADLVVENLDEDEFLKRYIMGE